MIHSQWRWIILIVLGCMLLIGFGSIDAEAGAIQSMRLQPTPFPTPTPGPDGRIIYRVQEGDSLWRIAAIAGLSLEELMAMNGIQPGDFISPGMELELGIGGPARPTPGEASIQPTTDVPSPTPTPLVGTAEICVLLFKMTMVMADLQRASWLLRAVRLVWLMLQEALLANTQQKPCSIKRISSATVSRI